MNKHFRQRYPIAKVMKQNIGDLQIINELQMKYNKKPLKLVHPKTVYQMTNFGSIDEDARLSVKYVERGQFAYFEHRIVDTLHHFIIATDITGANVLGHRILLTQVDRIKHLFSTYAKEIMLDTGYYNSYCAKSLLNIHRETISDYMKKFNEGGMDALLHRKYAPGRRPYLLIEEVQEVR